MRESIKTKQSIKNKISQLLSKYKHGNDIQEQEKH